MNDTIYRQAAIDAIRGAIFDFFDICDGDEESPMTYKDEQLLEINKAISGRIKQLPSAEPEIIHCKECKHWMRAYLDISGKFGCNIMRDYTAPNDYCFKAERKE